ncbi:MAG: DUF2391 domain-containing protein [Halobacteriaceae archaeon]
MPEDPPDVEDLVEQFAELEATVDSARAREQVRETRRLALAATDRGTFGRVVSGFGRADVAEAFLGGLVFGLPMFVEGGTLEVGTYVATRPAFLVATLALTVGTVHGILYVADFQDVRVTAPILGVVPRRMVGVLGVTALTAALGMTAWGRVDWTTPWLAACQTAVAYLPMAVGGAIGDILPGT